MMTKMHFETLATWLKCLPMPSAERQIVASSLADMLSTTNHRFDRRRFLIAAEAYQGNWPEGGISPIDGQYHRNAR